jgi:NADH-quinone oxidoreductase subunit N
VIALVATPDTFVKPHIEYNQLLPILVVFAAACLGVLIEAFLPRERRYLSQLGVALIALVVALVRVVIGAGDLPKLGDGAARGLFGSQGTVAIDGPTMFL